jgi:hypothetical protein
MSLNKDYEIEAINRMISEINGSSLSEYGVNNIKKLITKYGFKKVAESIPQSYEKYGDSFIDMLSKFINYSNSSEEDRHFMYSIGILKNRIRYYNKHVNAMLLKEARDLGINQDTYRDVVLTYNTWTEYRLWMESFIESRKAPF